MNLDTTIDIDLKGFFRWWGKELAFLIPNKLRRQLREHHGYVIFTPVGQEFDVAFFDDDNRLVVRRRMDLAENGGYQQFKNQYPALEKAEFVLRLASGQALQRVIYLPSAVQENLQQVIGFELDRYTPFKPDQAYFNTMPRLAAA